MTIWEQPDDIRIAAAQQRLEKLLTQGPGAADGDGDPARLPEIIGRFFQWSANRAYLTRHNAAAFDARLRRPSAGPTPTGSDSVTIAP
jgi:hypothetical protein